MKLMRTTLYVLLAAVALLTLAPAILFMQLVDWLHGPSAVSLRMGDCSI